MAALTATYKTGKLPVGHKVIRVIECTPGAASGDEWVDTGLSWIDAVLGCTFVSTAANPASPTVTTATAGPEPVFVLNSQGTDAADTDSGGDLGIEMNAGGTQVIQVTVIGKA